jgi:DNA primase
MNENLIQDIRNKADIVEIIRNYIPITKKGKSYVAVCPFHDDHTPSMSISTDKQIYKCFVCGAGGNVFNFVKDFEKIGFQEAVVKVAQLCNLEINESLLPKKVSIDPKTQTAFDALNDYVKFTQYTLASTEGNDARAYLLKRGLDVDTINFFEIGYNPTNHKASQYLQAKGHTLETLKNVNLSQINERGTYDVFENRITFPIHSPLGQVIAFSARALNQDAQSKYINSSETSLYNKSKVLYNLHRAKHSIKKNSFLILVEGVMDAIAYHRAGFENTVASLGTALSKDQIRLIQNHCNHVVLAYDFDAAGQTASLKTGRLLLSLGLKLEVISSNLGKDADEILNKHGNEALVKLVSSKRSYLDFLMEHSANAFDLNNYAQRKEFSRIMMEEISMVKDGFDRNYYLKKLSDLSGFNAEQLSLLSKNANPSNVSSKQKNISKEKERLNDWAEKEIIGQMLMSSNAMSIFRKELGYFPEESFQKIALKIMNYYRGHDILNIADFISEIQDDSLLLVITRIVESDIYYNSYSEEALYDAIMQVKIKMIDQQINAFKHEHQLELESMNNESILNSYQELLEKRRTLLRSKR